MNLRHGDMTTIRVKNPKWPYRKVYASYMSIPEFNTYTGMVIRNHKILRGSQIGLTTGDPKFDMRIIDIEDIVECNDIKKTVEKNEYRVWNITGSKGNKYTVTKDHGYYSCSCIGFGFRRHCKHVDTVKKEISDEQYA